LQTVAEDADDGSNQAHDIRGRDARLVLPGRAATIRRVSELYLLSFYLPKHLIGFVLQPDPQNNNNGIYVAP